MDFINMLLLLVNFSNDVEKIDYGYHFILKDNILISYDGIIEEFRESMLFDDELIFINEIKIKSILKDNWESIKILIND